MSQLFTRAFLFCTLALLLGGGYSLGREIMDSEGGGSAALAGAVGTLDRFMMAGRSGEAKRGASLLDMYESSPRKAELRIAAFYEEREDVFANYVSISKDIYGYEIKENGFRGPNINLEGGIETVSGLTAEFSARLVYRDQRWRILTLEID